MSWALSLPTETLKDSKCASRVAVPGQLRRFEWRWRLSICLNPGTRHRPIRTYRALQAGRSGEGRTDPERAIKPLPLCTLIVMTVAQSFTTSNYRGGANPAPRTKRGADDATGCNSQQNGVQPETERGAAAAPNPSLNHQVTEEQLQRDLADADFSTGPGRRRCAG